MTPDPTKPADISPRSKPVRFGGVSIPRGQTRDIRLTIGEHYTGDAITLPLRVIRGAKPGPVLAVTAAVHGDELNGAGIVHELMFSRTPELIAGTLVLVPVVNIFGVESQSRYMPDRRDLNRSFPGSPTGNLTSRTAHLIFEQIIKKCDVCLDLHSAAAPRTNYPNVRADLTNRTLRDIARAFGCELLVNGKGPEGCLRREATKAGVPTMILEAGEPSKIEPSVLEAGVLGVTNVLKYLGMVAGAPAVPATQRRINRSTWVRADSSGLLRFHVSPGQLIEKDQPVATIASIFGDQQAVQMAPSDGVVLGMTTLPTVMAGEPVCHIGVIGRRRTGLGNSSRAKRVNKQLKEDFARAVTISEAEADGVTESPGNGD